ncbi:hypothetical protein HYV88_05765 [Candidatus Woesearchaeota archaeon]|nr:hypothetical protein [Candidatus Woesearchaeota archaeon]
MAKTRLSFGKKILFSAIPTILTLGFVDQIPTVYIDKFREFQKIRQCLLGSDLVQGRNQSFEGTETIHPTRGYLYDPDFTQQDKQGQVQINELGTKGRLPPLNPNPNERSVVVFGGSVAEDLAFDIDRGKALEEALTPISEGRKVIVSCGAVIGYKQPEDYQSLLDFVSRGYHLDDMIHLSGFNDVALFPAENLKNNVYYRYPRQWASRVYRPPEYIERIMLAYGFSFPILDTSTIANSIWKTLDNRIMENRTKMQLDGKRNFLRDGPQNPFYFSDSMTSEERQKQEEVMLECLADNWRFYIERMNSLCLEMGIRPHFFLQPNQYVEPSSLDIEANRKAIQESGPMNGDFMNGQWVKRGYPYLKGKLKELEKKGINVVDLTMVYKDVNQQVYCDTCCHVNEVGNRILAEEIARHIATD